MKIVKGIAKGIKVGKLSDPLKSYDVFYNDGDFVVQWSVDNVGGKHEIGILEGKDFFRIEERPSYMVKDKWFKRDEELSRNVNLSGDDIFDHVKLDNGSVFIDVKYNKEYVMKSVVGSDGRLYDCYRTLVKEYMTDNDTLTPEISVAEEEKFKKENGVFETFEYIKVFYRLHKEEDNKVEENNKVEEAKEYMKQLKQRTTKRQEEENRRLVEEPMYCEAWIADGDIISGIGTVEDFYIYIRGYEDCVCAIKIDGYAIAGDSLVDWFESWDKKYRGVEELMPESNFVEDEDSYRRFWDDVDDEKPVVINGGDYDE